MHPIGEKIRKLREERGLKLYELAQAAKMDNTYLSQIERGKVVEPKRGTLTRIAKALGMRLDELQSDDLPNHVRASVKRRHADDSRFTQLANAWEDLSEEARESLYNMFLALGQVARPLPPTGKRKK